MNILNKLESLEFYLNQPKLTIIQHKNSNSTNLKELDLINNPLYLYSLKLDPYSINVNIPKSINKFNLIRDSDNFKCYLSEDNCIYSFKSTQIFIQKNLFYDLKGIENDGYIIE